MKHIILFLCAWLAGVGHALADTMLADTLTVGADENATLTVNLRNAEAQPTAWQLLLTLPEGLSIVHRDGGDYDCTLSSRHDADSHVLTVVEHGQGCYMLVCYSGQNLPLSGTDGALFTASIHADKSVRGQLLTGMLSGVLLSDADGQKWQVPDTVFHASVVYPVITVDNAQRSYGDAALQFTYTVAGAALRGTPQISTEATVTSPVGTYAITAQRGTIDNAYYEVVNGTLTIEPAPLTISAGTYTKKQGEAMPEFVLSYEGFKNGETESVLTKLPSVSCVATEASAPGEYPVTVSGAEAQNYAISYTNGKLIVTEADPVTIMATSYTREYGDENPVFEYTADGAPLDGTPEVICEATATSPVGTYDIIVHQGSVKNYNVSYVAGTLTITPAPLAISAGTYTKKQGEAMPEFALNYGGFKNDESESVLVKKPTVSCEATEASAPGEYPVTVSGAEAQNYAISYTNGKLIVTEADPVTIMATSYTREYGDENPVFEYTADGAPLDGTPEVICEATATSPVGTYDIIVCQGSVKNYNVSYLAGTLAIEPAPLTVSAGSYSREEGEENPEFVLTYSGWKNGEDESALTVKPVATTTATTDSPVGEYAITVSGGEAQNYTFTYVDGVLTVTESSGINALLSAGRPFDVYTTTGLKLRHQVTTLDGLPKGVYIVGGRKVAVR